MKTKGLRASVPALLVPLLASTFVAVGAGAASASAQECATHQLTREESNTICLNVQGKGLTVKSIYGRYMGIWGRPKLTLYINGKLASSQKAPKSRDDWGVDFPKKLDKKYANGTTMKICLSEVSGDIPAKSLCTTPIKIHS
ncbi:hypothetical protein [Streptomyces sp. NPDC096152]|uniref:hypothetical protein n=1 Tax=Streptomyces sp. NPDC096152 TaxID=3366078 RepID=UPI003802C0E8